MTHRIEASNPRTFLEWQANRFAAGVLMPRRTVRAAVVDIQRARGRGIIATDSPVPGAAA